MAPTLEDVAGLKDLVKQLQERIHKIEQSITGDGKDSKSSPGELRMILMGPPGAGSSTLLVFVSLIYFFLDRPPRSNFYYEIWPLISACKHGTILG